MCVADLGITTAVSSVPRKASRPMLVTPLPIVTEVSELAAKAYS
eukprot:COSAG02_NODE_55608_length_289_cov_1.094737_1_plen_43_part_10